MKATAEKEERCATETEEQPAEFFCRSWAQRDLGGNPQPGTIAIDLVRPDGRFRMSFYNLHPPFFGSHFADLDAAHGRLNLRIAEDSFTVEGFVLEGRRHIACRSDGVGPAPQGWDAEEEN